MATTPEEPLVTTDGDDDLVVVQESPFNAETAPYALRSPITPAGAHYVRANFAPPQLDARRHRVRVEGAVGQPFDLGVDELGALPWRSVTVTLECAGNHRTGLMPLPPGEPWAGGAVSTAVWAGPPLGLLLERAGVRDDAVELLVTGADSGRPQGSEATLPFARSLPIDVARSPDVLLALEMNGRPLPVEHGAPVRLVVPGWYGMASVKWVARIAALTEPFAGWFQGEKYVYKRDGQSAPVDLMRVKSMIVSPSVNAQVRVKALDVWGWAWSGTGAVTGVEVALDGGAFVAATLDEALAPHAWRRFRLTVPLPKAGRHVLRARARDSSGAVQPDSPRWNELGYGNHAVQPLVFYSR